MDWDNPMAVFGFDDEPRQHDSEVYDDADDFYGDEKLAEDARPGAPDHVKPVIEQQIPTTATIPQPFSAQEKDKNQKRAEMLRAKLLAQRQNTPSKVASRSGTPAQMNPPSSEIPSQAPTVPAQPQQQSQTNTAVKEEVKEKAEKTKLPSDMNGVEALLDRGKAIADAKTAALAANAAATEASNKPAVTPNGEAQHLKQPPTQHPNPAQEPTPQTIEHPKRPANLSHAYYADLPAWLEMTGYHDVDFRTSKLSTYKERKALEEEAARIAERLEKLKQAEQEVMQSLRLGTPKPAATNMAPPPLPAIMPNEKATPKANGTNGTKRPHSPASLPPEKARRREDTGGFRIRGANDSPTDARPPPLRRPRTPSPAELERRITYPDPRRRSIGERKPSEYGGKSRDPSLERRQSYYRQDGDVSLYDSYTPREPPRPNYGAPKRNNSFKAPQYRGSAPLDLRKGGVRYFMIKSWNHENVVAAQRENMWATQEKNEQLLEEAYNTSRHVILLFSVNKSMAFQGYALMTSPPDPNIPKPAFASKLNWGTSAAFTLRWLGTTPIRFGLIGHLKNTLNKNEKGESRAVLVGYDGQEISADAGVGVVWALDEAEATENERHGRH